MNLWLVKLSERKLSPNDVRRIEETAKKLFCLQNAEMYEFTARGVHYVSWTPPHSYSQKRYNGETDGVLTAYSGLLVGGDSSPDYRDARNVRGDLQRIARDCMGQFALMQAGDGRFLCLADVLGHHKVFYYHDSADGAYYVSNTLNALKQIKKPAVNFEFLTEYYCAQEAYGLKTDDSEIFSLPEFGRIEYANGQWRVGAYDEIAPLIRPEAPYRDLLENAADRFLQAGRYLAKYHSVLVPLSGGYDSRLALHILSGLGAENVRCWSYNSGKGKRELRVAAKVAAAHGFPHSTVELPKDDLPAVETLEREAFALGFPYRSYMGVLDYLCFQHTLSFYRDRLKATINGNGGDVGLIAKCGFSEPNVDAFAKWRIDDKLLNPDYKPHFLQSLKQFFSQRFADCMDDLGDAYFFFERYRGFQGFIISQTRLPFCDMFSPFGSREFIQTCFARPVAERFRNKPNSIHHDLTVKLTGGRFPRIHFEHDPHWEAGPMTHKLFQLDSLWTRVRRRFFHKSDYATNMRNQFLRQNVDFIDEAMREHQNSDFFNYIQKDWFERCATDPNLRFQYYKNILSLIPLLKYVDDPGIHYGR